MKIKNKKFVETRKARVSKVFSLTFSTEKVSARSSAGLLNLLRSKSSTQVKFRSIQLRVQIKTK